MEESRVRQIEALAEVCTMVMDAESRGYVSRKEAEDHVRLYLSKIDDLVDN
jgi:hypothetical protein